MGLVHYRPFSVTSEESLRDSEPPLKAPRDRRLHEVKDLCVIHTDLHTLSDVCMRYMCFVKL